MILKTPGKWLYVVIVMFEITYVELHSMRSGAAYSGMESISLPTSEINKKSI